MSALISSAQLDKFCKSGKNITILDVTTGSVDKSAYQSFLEEHIPSARYLDLNLLVDPNNPLPNTVLRDLKKVNEVISSFGITKEHKIVFYDHDSHHSSYRALWLFKLYGHDVNQLYIYDGGLAEWKRFGGKAETGEPRRVTPKDYQATLQTSLIRSLDQMKKNITSPSEQVVDTRHPTRFAGGKEHRPNMRFGHIPGSYCFPAITMFDKQGRLKPLEKIKKQLTGIGVQLDYPIIAMCGSGITACILDVVLDFFGHEVHAVYDGSWAEWGYDQLFPGETNLSERPVVTSLE